MILKKIPENPGVVNGDLHEWIFLEDFDEGSVGFFVSIFQDMGEISNGLMIMDTKYYPTASGADRLHEHPVEAGID